MEGEEGFGEEEGEGVEWIDNDISFKVGGEEFDAEIDNPAPEGEEGFGDEAGLEGEEGFGDEAGLEGEEEFNDEEDLNLEAIIRELEGANSIDSDGDQLEENQDEDAAMEEPMGESIDEIIEAILREEYDEEVVEEAKEDEEKKEMKKELEEAYSTVSELKSILSEVNLLNAKLLYTNKLFRNFELSEDQKMKVIENFDRAGNTREVKLVFTTLAESFNKPKTKRVVKESIASKPVASTAPKQETTQVLSEGFELANRWKKLAGLL